MVGIIFCWKFANIHNGTIWKGRRSRVAQIHWVLVMETDWIISTGLMAAKFSRFWCGRNFSTPIYARQFCKGSLMCKIELDLSKLTFMAQQFSITSKFITEWITTSEQQECVSLHLPLFLYACNSCNE